MSSLSKSTVHGTSGSDTSEPSGRKPFLVSPERKQRQNPSQSSKTSEKPPDPRPDLRKRSQNPKNWLSQADQRGSQTIRVPRGENDKIPPQAFFFHTEVRHVLVEPGVRIVGGAACLQLQVIQLPDTAVSLLHGAFRCCRALRVVIAPGCQHFGLEVFLSNSNRSNAVP